MATAVSTRDRLDRLFQQRIAIFDGSMGVMLQHKGLSDADFRGERFRDHPKPLRNNSDVLCLTQPALVTHSRTASSPARWARPTSPFPFLRESTTPLIATSRSTS